ncbi:MAG: class I SAM-dependent methyltransferase, partial [Candidatus Andersenbacteria bacterium]
HCPGGAGTPQTKVPRYHGYKPVVTFIHQARGCYTGSMPWLYILTGIGLLLLLPTAYAGWIGAPYAPTRLRAVTRVLTLLKAGRHDTLVDLGAGDGKILREAARYQARAIGYELSPIMWGIARWRTWGQTGIALRYGNFYRHSLPVDTTIVFAFLMPENMPRVRAYLARQHVPHGKYFLTYAFPFADIPPRHIIKEPQCAALYVYDLSELTQPRA